MKMNSKISYYYHYYYYYCYYYYHYYYFLAHSQAAILSVSHLKQGRFWDENVLSRHF